MEQVTSPLLIYGAGRCTAAGLSLRGSFRCAEHRQQLQDAIERMLTQGCRTLWIDCRFLQGLSTYGQHAMLQAHYLAHSQLATLYWCGLPQPLYRQLQRSGISHQLQLRPAEDFQGPTDLLHEWVPTRPLTLISAGL